MKPELTQRLEQDSFAKTELQIQLVKDLPLIPLHDHSVKENFVMEHGHDSSGCFRMKKLPGAE